MLKVFHAVVGHGGFDELHILKRLSQLLGKRQDHDVLGLEMTGVEHVHAQTVCGEYLVVLDLACDQHVGALLGSGKNIRAAGA